MQDAELSTVAPIERKLYYGWIMLPLSMLAMVATSAGQTYGISAFNKDIGHSLALTETQLAKAYMLGTILGAIPIYYFGALMDRYGLRRTVLVTVCLLSIACLSLAATNSWWMLVVSFCLLRMLGPGTLAMLSGNVMAFWFQQRLGFVEALRKLSLSVAMGSVPALNYYLLKFFSWREVYAIWGCGIWLTLFPVFFLLFRNHPEDVGQRLEGRNLSMDKGQESYLDGLSFAEALRTSTFWALTAGSGMFALVMTAVVFNRISIMEQQDLGEWHSAMMMSVLSGTWAVTQFIGGNFVDRFPAKPMLIVGLLLFSLGMVTLKVMDSTILVLLAGGLMGMSQGFYSGASHPMWARNFGRSNLGKITGCWMTLMVAASASGPYIAGALRDYFGGFDESLMVFAILPIPVAGLTLLAQFTSLDEKNRANLEQS